MTNLETNHNLQIILGPKAPEGSIETNPTGIILHEYEATPFIEGKSKEDAHDVIKRKNPFLTAMQEFLDKERIKKAGRIIKISNELLENIYKHRIPASEKITTYESARLQKNGNSVTMETTNTITPQEAILLKEKVNHVNTLFKEGGLKAIKDEYLTILSDEKISEKGGGNMGRYELIKKTNNPIEISFDEQEDGNKKVTLKIKFDLTEDDYYSPEEYQEHQEKLARRKAKEEAERIQKEQAAELRKKELAKIKFHAAVSNVYDRTQEAVLD